ncbi:MAG TPA: endonuclease III [Phycisphaerales bacterium]|nr:endonuclease III [Phycisphaerales bacterium]
MPRESKQARIERVKKLLAALRREFPDATCALHFRTPLELLVATILSAQCTDARVNLVTPALFAKYRTAGAFAAAPQETLEQEIRSTGFFRNKARNIRGACAILAEEHGGRVPETMDELLALPGVARKTANVVLGTAYGKNEGVVVDTHVQRLAGRLGLTAHASNQGDRIEKDLMSVVPREQWTFFAHALVLHGRKTCTARKPDCPHCPLAKLCPSAGKV